jgi:hypothetical protein
VLASHLERTLLHLSQRSDASSTPPSDMQKRFETLRGYGCLPQGRENRSTRLNPSQIAHAVLGLTPTEPAWAGHSAVVLAGLRPVGGEAASLMGTQTLAAAIALLCSSNEARSQLVVVTLSIAEAGVNSAGFADVALRDGSTIRHVCFVSPLAVSLLQRGAELSFDPTIRFSHASRQLILNRNFFDRLTRDVVASEHWPEAAGNGSEYDSDDARRARLKALGVGINSRFLNVGVDTQVTWPKQETLVRFDGFKLVLMPKTANSTQSVHVDLHSNGLSDTEADTLVNRLLSVMAWCSDQFAIWEGGWSGNSAPVAVPKRDLAFSTAIHWIFDRKIPATDEQRRALAHYREGRNAEEASLVSYAVLSYFKIIELQHKDGKGVRRWIAANVGCAAPTDPTDRAFAEFEETRGTETPEDYLWRAGRLAVAHASVKRPSDADDAQEIRRLYVAAGIMRRLARHFIIAELSVSESPYSGN